MTSTLFVDLDGTIMRNPFWSAVFPIVAERLAGSSGQPATAIIEMIVAESAARKANEANAAWATDWDDIVRAVARRLGVSFDLSVEQVVIDNCHPPHIAVLDDAATVLRALADNGWQIVAATHGQARYQVPVLKALGLLPLFADLATPDRRGCWKQQQGFWQPYLDAGGTLIHVGDLYEDDVLAPKRLGLHAVWKAKPADGVLHDADPFRRAAVIELPMQQAVRPDAVIFHLGELPAVVSRLRQGDVEPR